MSADTTSLGTRLREERTKRRMSPHALAEAFLQEASARDRRRMPAVDDIVRTIYGHEADEHPPGPWYRILYSAVFEIPEEELFEELLEQRKKGRHSASSRMTSLLPPGGLSEQLASAGAKSIRIGSIEDLFRRVHALRLADDLLSGGDLLGPAFRELDAAERAHKASTNTGQEKRDLLRIIGECAQIAGWIASDAGQHQRAADTYQRGIDVARLAGDGVLESNLTGSLAYQISNVGADPAKAVRLASTAVEAAGPHGPSRARALAWDRVAWAHAKAQDAQEAMRALGEASDALADYDAKLPDPGYLYWVDAGELQIMEARVYTELRRPLRAVPLLLDVLSRYDAAHARELTLYMSWLAVALADANEVEEAAATARRMFELGSNVASVRTAQRERVVLDRLEPHRDVPAVRELLEISR